MSHESVSKTYQLLCEIYGVHSSGWSMLHEKYNWAVFCPENRKSIVAEFLIWDDFVRDAEQYNVVYYYGIDLFLREYRLAVQSCLNKDMEGMAF